MSEMKNNSLEKKRYLKFGNESGCLIENYKYTLEHETKVVLADDVNEQSGTFRLDF